MESKNSNGSENAEEPNELIGNQNDSENIFAAAEQLPTSENNNFSNNRRRNYRQRTADDDESSDDGEINMEEQQQSGENSNNAQPAVEPAQNENENNSEHEDLEISDNAATDSDTETSDSDFSFDSPLSPLLRFGLGSRRIFGHSDSDSDSTEDNEEIREKANKTTTEIMNKEMPSHNQQGTWPMVLMNRERGFFCKPIEARYSNNRKVFEKRFYGSLNAVQRLELMARLNEHLGCVNSLGFSNNGQYLLSGSDDQRIILWNWYNQKALSVKNTKHKKNIFQTKFYDDSDMRAVSSSADGTISIHQFTNDGGHWEKQVYTHAGAVHKLTISDNVIYTCGEDGLIIEFDYRTKSPTKLTTVREKHRKISLFAISAHPSESKYAVCGRDQFVRIYDRRNEKVVLTRHCPQELLQKNTTIRYISCCAYNYNGSELIASYNDENIYLFDSNNHNLGTYKHKYQGHVNSATIKGVNFFGPESEYIVTGSDCSHIFFYDKEKESIVQFMMADDNGIVNVLEPHPIYPVLATSGLDKDVKIWMPSNDDFVLNRDNLKKCVNENMKVIYESNQTASFSLNPAIIELARRFFQRHRDPSTSPNPLPFVYRSSDSSNDTD
ncbi:hypothetical protein PVAND_001977 [Polypedilum vanderplanki]|uniref:Uncharacterized protein n=1 Tax=Polypedilum vanderplanki TaxID=319348 RepID=A0A9J6BPW5_POLVA|nr:hypothetical protein PVAND_001977 [Polypedilum vanderplanki]